MEIYLEKPIGLKTDKKILEEIKNIMEYFLKNFKENSLVKYFYSIYLKKNGKFLKSKQILIKLINYIEFELKLKVPLKWIWSLANTLISLGEFKLAIKELEKLNSYSFFSTIQLVNSCQTLGDRKTAIKVLKNFKSKKTNGTRYSNIILDSLQSLESKQFSIPLYTITLEVLFFRNFLNFLPIKKLELIKKQLDQLELNDISNYEKDDQEEEVEVEEKFLIKQIQKKKKKKKIFNKKKKKKKKIKKKKKKKKKNLFKCFNFNT